MKKDAPPLGIARRNDRQFPIVEFADAYGHACSLIASSAIGQYPDSFDRPGSSFLWIGLNDVEANVMARDAAEVGVRTNQKVGWVPYPIPQQVSVWTRMHLNREQVAGLIVRLEQWLAEANFDSPANAAPEPIGPRVAKCLDCGHRARPIETINRDPRYTSARCPKCAGTRVTIIEAT